MVSIALHGAFRSNIHGGGLVATADDPAEL